MKPQRHHDTKTKRRRQAVCLSAISLCLCVLVVEIVFRVRAQQGSGSPNSPTSSTQAETLEGCLKCHDKIEPMHRFGPTATLDKLDHGKDALGLSCTACHGGNPAATEKDSAHVRPRFPRQPERNGKIGIPERS